MATISSTRDDQETKLKMASNFTTTTETQASTDDSLSCSQAKQSPKTGGENLGDKSPRQSSGTGEMKSSTSNKARKRTKTGCLTCRRRRIKCGEERPTCSNCVKSKRNCEGYTPRVIFKDPLGAYRPSASTASGGGSHFQPLATHNGAIAQYGPLQPGNASQAPLPVIAPRPTHLEDQAWTNIKVADNAHRDAQFVDGQSLTGQPYAQSDLPPRMWQHMAQRNGSLEMGPIATGKDASGKQFAASASLSRPPNLPDRDSGIDLHYPGLSSDWPHNTTPPTPVAAAYRRHSSHNYDQHASEMQSQVYPPLQPHLSYVGQSPSIPQDSWQSFDPTVKNDQHWPTYVPPAAPDRYDQDHGFSKSNPSANSQDKHSYVNRSAASPVGHSRSQIEPSHNSSDQYNPNFSTNVESSMEDPDDDYFDVTSDEEQPDPDITMTETSPADLGLMLAMSANQNNRGIRSLTNYLNESNVLSNYRPSYAASPLMDPQTARIFCHFVTATAPTLSLHNRHPVNPSVMFTGAPVPPYQRSLFTYTLPMMALSNQGLLHSQLALASLHIAKLQQTSPTPSLKHYHYALRRVAKAVGHPNKRRDVATLAATLLLGFYEVTTAEHNKWNSHLAGARELILEVDYAGMTKRINAYKAETSAHNKSGFYSYGQDTFNKSRLAFDILRTDKELDENLISTIMGWRTRYDEYGRVIDQSEPPSHYHVPLTSKDVETFEIQCDLFWWYAKQDMYQSLVSGNRLLLSYDRWSHCPPRAPCGRLDVVYGSMDHLILLFARLTDFAARDVVRKIKTQAKVEEKLKRSVSQEAPPWAPTQKAQTVSNAASNDQSPVAPSQSRPPPMYGMMPAPGPVHLPSGFDQSRHDQLDANNQVIVKDAELEVATRTAEREWADIWAALDMLENAFGPEYQPLSPDHMAPLSTPFGPALYYRTYSISCVWALFYTARMFAVRVGPGMPPAAMAAAGLAAPRTAQWANIIGRICGGLQPFSATASLNPSHGAALMDSCMGLFHAGVQYRDAAQRGWTITKLRDIARLTGWQTSALIASGCERSWIAAAEMGKGPPYTRTMNASAKDDRVSGRSRKPNQGPPKDNNDRRFITINPGTRVYWAMGLLSAEEDMKHLKLDE